MSANEFRVSAFYEQVLAGNVVTVQIRRRIKGAASLVLAGGFLFDLNSLSAPRADLERIHAEATRNGDFKDDGSTHD